MGEGEPTRSSGSLFGRDGTDLPDPMSVLPDPLNAPKAFGEQQTPALPPISLPAAPNDEELRRAIAAALGEDPDSLDGEAAADPDPPHPPGAGPLPTDSPPTGPSPTAPPPTGPSPTAPPPTESSPTDPPRSKPEAPAATPPAPAESAPPPAAPVQPPRRPLHPVPPPYSQRHHKPRNPAAAGRAGRKEVGSGCVIMLVFLGLAAYYLVSATAGSLSALLQ